MVCEDPNSKLVEAVSVADVDDDNRFDDSFMQIWKLNFVPTLSRRFGQEFEVEVKANFRN